MDGIFSGKIIKKEKTLSQEEQRTPQLHQIPGHIVSGFDPLGSPVTSFPWEPNGAVITKEEQKFLGS